uniref:Uncharacterized protein n=1 Tax=Anguilla anguilla TaxID=7936 RepID=A0A0E9VAH7_ANGAN
MFTMVTVPRMSSTLDPSRTLHIPASL